MHVLSLPTRPLTVRSTHVCAGGEAATEPAKPFLRPRPQPSPGPGLGQLEHAYGELGGLVACEALLAQLRMQCDQPLSLLARWIVGRCVLSFEAQGQRWLPVFQFEPGAPRVRAGVAQVIGELEAVYDDLELALWFAEPSTWLDDARPAQVLVRNPAAVLDAARAHRFVIRG